MQDAHACHTAVPVPEGRYGKWVVCLCVSLGCGVSCVHGCIGPETTPQDPREGGESQPPKHRIYILGEFNTSPMREAGDSRKAV
jgi:hypothetical protein